jgi:hypothetical protein
VAKGVTARTGAWWSSTHGSFGSMARKGDHDVMLGDQGTREQLEAVELGRRFVVVVEALSRRRNNPAVWSLLTAAHAALQWVIDVERQGKHAAVAAACNSQPANQQASNRSSKAKRQRQQSRASYTSSSSGLEMGGEASSNGLALPVLACWRRRKMRRHNEQQGR